MKNLKLSILFFLISFIISEQAFNSDSTYIADTILPTLNEINQPKLLNTFILHYTAKGLAKMPIEYKMTLRKLNSECQGLKIENNQHKGFLDDMTNQLIHSIHNLEESVNEMEDNMDSNVKSLKMSMKHISNDFPKKELNKHFKNIAFLLNKKVKDDNQKVDNKKDGRKLNKVKRLEKTMLNLKKELEIKKKIRRLKKQLKKEDKKETV